MPPITTVKAPLSAVSASNSARNSRLAWFHRSLTPSEFAGALTESGILRSARWVREHCAAGRIAILPLPGNRYEIPGRELVRILAKLEDSA